jgi:hypothetical protein
LDFIIFTDHGNPNRESLKKQGKIHGVLVLSGSELSVNRGHLVALGFDPPQSSFSHGAEEAVREIQVRNGFSIIAHPYSKVQWSWGESTDYHGLEILNGDSFLKRNFLSSLPYLPTLLIKPKFALLKMIDDPHLNLKKWDELNQRNKIYGYYSADAHFLYRPLFSLLHLHVLLESPLAQDYETAKAQLVAALKEGRFYNAVEAAACARGFRFWAKVGDENIPMGKEISFKSPITLFIKVPTSFSKEILLLRNGKEIFRSEKRRSSFVAEQTGTYRVEVYLREKTPLGNNIPWILSNPIYIGKEEHDGY